jgi:transposase
MTYSLDFRKQALKSLDDGMMFAQAVEFYNISPTTIQKWKKRIHSKTTRQVKPHKVTDERLLKDVKVYPDSYHYERARRLKCSKSGICEALKRLGISQKKDIRASKSMLNQAGALSE